MKSTIDKNGNQQPNEELNPDKRMEQLRERFLYLIEIWAANRGRYAWLEKRTGIPAARWQNVLLEKQKPTMEMVIAVCHHLESYTFWLIHGKKPSGILSQSQNAPEEGWEKFQNHREWLKEFKKRKKGIA